MIRVDGQIEGVENRLCCENGSWGPKFQCYIKREKNAGVTYHLRLFYTHVSLSAHREHILVL